MFFLIFLYTLVVLFASCLQPIDAFGTTVRPLKRVFQPSTLSIEILPRHPQLASHLNKRLESLPSNSLRYDDTLRLIISAFDETFYLHLRPNDHLVHPAARVDYYTRLPDGSEVLSQSEPLLRHEIRAYLGEVIAEHHSATRMREDAARVYPQPHPAVLGWARIMVHYPGDAENSVPPLFEGAFSVGSDIYHVMTKDNYLRNKHELDPNLPNPTHQLNSNLIIWRDSDQMTPAEERLLRTSGHLPESPIPQSCGHDRLRFNNITENPVLGRPDLPPYPSWIGGLLGPTSDEPIFRRDDAPGGGMGTDFRSSIGSTEGCPTTQKVLYMGVAADCVYVSRQGSKENATTQILTNWNSASSLYKNTFNVSLGITEIQIRDPVCPSTADPAFPWNVPCSSAQLDARLSLFSQWRGAKGSDGNGLWHLMSGCPTGAEVGIAWLGTLCQSTAAGRSPTIVSGAAVSTAGRTEWQVIAHEIGHNFGAIHDCASDCSTTTPCCPLSASTCSAEGRFIMSPVSQAGESMFSPCSLGNICSVMRGVTGGRVNTSCLFDPDRSRQTISLKMCGNGIVEEGEDCDPGKGVNSTCCDVNTCKFTRDAQCDPDSSPCCTQQCTFASSTQVCRPSKDPKCDTVELCTGNSSACPRDIVAPNGQNCGDNNLACASGICTSVAQQCQVVGAPLGLQQACPDRSDQSCQLSCQDPQNANSCVRLSSMLIDGSPCGFGGTCASGKCQSAGVIGTAKAWYTSNLQISIPVTIVAGLIVSALVYSLIRALVRCCRRRKQPQPVISATRPLAHSGHARLISHDGVIGPRTRVPSATRSSRRHRDRNTNHMNWVEETRYNGPQGF